MCLGIKWQLVPLTLFPQHDWLTPLKDNSATVALLRKIILIQGSQAKMFSFAIRSMSISRNYHSNLWWSRQETKTNQKKHQNCCRFSIKMLAFSASANWTFPLYKPSSLALLWSWAFFCQGWLLTIDLAMQPWKSVTKSISVAPFVREIGIPQLHWW